MKFVVLDIETTGFSPLKGGRIIEIGAVKVEDGNIVDRFSTFVNPELKIPKKIVELTHIDDSMVRNSPTVWKVLHELWDFIEGYTVVAHNAKFDWDTYLKPAFKKMGKHATNAVICTQVKSKEIYGSKIKQPDGTEAKVGHKLMDLCTRNGIVLEGAHRAINDCEALAHCLIKMIDEYPDKFKDLKESKGISLDENRNSSIDYQIHSVNYWEKEFDKGKKTEKILKRFYVSLIPENSNLIERCYPGTVFYDITTKSWRNKDFLYNLDYKIVEKRVLEFEKVLNIDELIVKKAK